MPSLKQSLSKSFEKRKQQREPLWKGPEVDGITQSMIQSFLGCRERFRVKYLLGLRPVGKFEARIEYGQMWHICEENLAARRVFDHGLKKYATDLCRQYPLEQEQINKWYRVCLTQFPIYVDYWKRNKDVIDRTPIFQEYVFKVPYRLPYGRTVLLRGKFDSVDLIKEGRKHLVYLQENKTKSEINELKLQRQLTFDLQTMLYLVALTEIQHSAAEDDPSCELAHPLGGVRYNVIRRPLSGGKGTIVKHKPTKSKPKGESDNEYYERLRAIISEDPASFFCRFKIRVTEEDLATFKKQFLDPVLTQLCLWYDYQTGGGDHLSHYHYRHPFGTYNVLDEGGSTDLDEFLLSGNEVGLSRVDSLFGELK